MKTCCGGSHGTRIMSSNPANYLSGTKVWQIWYKGITHTRAVKVNLLNMIPKTFSMVT